MGNRLSKIVTRTGDDGSTGLGDGTRVAKTAARVDAMGDIDELNSALGALRAAGTLPPEFDAQLLQIQHDLFDLGGELSIPGSSLIDDARSAWLEECITAANAALPPLKEFILPGGGRATAACHLARAICRRAERHGWLLAAGGSVNPASLRYLNRLSDLLFVQARVLARAENGTEVLWRRRPG